MQRVEGETGISHSYHAKVVRSRPLWHHWRCSKKFRCNKQPTIIAYAVERVHLRTENLGVIKKAKTQELFRSAYISHLVYSKNSDVSGRFCLSYRSPPGCSAWGSAGRQTTGTGRGSGSCPGTRRGPVIRCRRGRKAGTRTRWVGVSCTLWCDLASPVFVAVALPASPSRCPDHCNAKQNAWRGERSFTTRSKSRVTVHGGLLSCDVLWTYTSVQTPWRNILPPSPAPTQATIDIFSAVRTLRNSLSEDWSPSSVEFNIYPFQNPDESSPNLLTHTF